ncbi:APC family permease [uncultured Chryseobacterium sp.]|uniref:APC family permease n=1 Tax=uncultured Chryseobacterium sp. TaxID=259322 RepID=UPI0025EE34F8|nr:APC family permease [uncultured Chryseobacterium sp.]
MELRIHPFPKNTYPRKGLLIRGAAPMAWLHEIEILGIDLTMVRSFPVPANEPNILYGCFLVFQHEAPAGIGKNAYFQCVDDQLFIPEYTLFFPKVSPEEWSAAGAELLLMHPEFGMVKLNEEIDWLSLISDPLPSEAKIRKPSAGVKVPQEIKSYAVEIDDEKTLEALQKPGTEQEWMNNLPFDLQKVMNGNKKEIEKYLKYIEKYPERAVDLGVPLDVTGTSRGDGFAKFIFNSPWIGKLFGGGREKEDSSYSGRYRWIFWAFLIVLGLVRLITYLNRGESAPEETASSGKVSGKPDENMMTPTVAYQSGVTDIDLKIDSIYGTKRKELMREHLKASFSRKNEQSYEAYLKAGGRPIGAIQNDIAKLNERTDAATDSLRRVYRKKIVTYLVKNEQAFRKKIADSLRKTGSGKPAAEGVVKKILKKKQMLVEDSLGRLYGTKDYPEPPPVNPEKALHTQYKGTSTDQANRISFTEIFWLIVSMIGMVGLYSFIVKKRSLNIGGDHVPAGIKIFLMLVLVAMVAYIFYPLIAMFGYNWFVWFLIICVVLLLYRLFSEDKTILKSDKDE